MQKLLVYSKIDKVRRAFKDKSLIKKLLKNKKIVVISPHSDDVSLSVGGTMAMLSGANTITPVLFFSGYRGVAGLNKEKAIKIREKEMIKEANILRLQKPIFLRLSSYDKKGPSVLRGDTRKVGECLLKLKPDVIFLPKKDDAHPRHKMAAIITLKAIKKPVKLFFYENHWSTFDEFEFDSVFVFGKKEMVKKVKAIKVHKSQLKRTDFSKASRALAELRGAVVPEQRICGYSHGKIVKNIFIEAFKCR